MTRLVYLALLLQLCQVHLCQQQQQQQRPVLQMAQEYVQLPENQTAAAAVVQLGVQLVGRVGSKPVRAWLALSSQQNATAGWLEEEADAWLQPSELRWGAGETGVRFVRVRAALAELLADLEEGAVVEARISAASNAGVQWGRGTTLLSLEPRQQQQRQHGAETASASGPLFGFLPNQIAYPPALGSSGSRAGNDSREVRIPVRLLSGQLVEPATLRYKVSLLTPVWQQCLPTSALTGFLLFMPNGSVEQSIALPVAWARVPAEAEYRLGLELEGVWGVRTQNQTDAVALHLFGVRNDTCPPGTALLGAVASSIAKEASKQQRPVGTAGQKDWSDLPGVEELFLLVDGSPLEISSRPDSSRRSYGAMVEPDVENATLCIRGSESLLNIQVSGKGDGGVQEIMGDADISCGCLPAASPVQPPVGSSAKECGYVAWQLSLPKAGQNEFRLRLKSGNVTVAANISGNSSSGNSSSSGGSKSLAAASERFSLAVVRLAEPAHAQLASLALRSSDGTNVLLCNTPDSRQVLERPGESSSSSSGDEGGVDVTLKVEEFSTSAATDAPQNSSQPPSPSGYQQTALPQLLQQEQRRASMLPWPAKPCVAGVTMSVNVSYTTEMVTLTPILLYPEVLGVRVEVNGQVLTRGADIGADQAADTTAQAGNRSSDLSFLPAAFFMGLRPGQEVGIQVVVVAEDGVTSLRYPIAVRRLPNPAPPPMPIPLSPGQQRESSRAPGGWIDAGEVVTYEVPVSTAEQRSKGWPKSPAQQDTCSICPAGWASSSVNASQCTMCSPGTYAAEAQSARCLPCAPGSYAYSWGSSHCKHCIAGTHAPQARSSLCRMCPANWTNMEDGQAACTVRATPAVDYSQRYAVLVSFNVYLSGLDPQEVLLKSGVYAPLEQIVGSLIQSDTASAFNISLQDVMVQTSSPGSTRRVLQANVTAALGVDLPPGATEEDIGAALEVQKLSADKPIEMLSQDPDRFFGRTTRTLDVEVTSGNAVARENWPGDSPHLNPLFLLIPGIAAVLLGAGLVAWACRRSPRCRAWWQRRWRERGSARASAWQLPAALVRSLGRGAQRYVRYSASSS